MRAIKELKNYLFVIPRTKVLYGTQQPKKPKFGSGGFITLSEVKLVD